MSDGNGGGSGGSGGGGGSGRKTLFDKVKNMSRTLSGKNLRKDTGGMPSEGHTSVLGGNSERRRSFMAQSAMMPEVAPAYLEDERKVMHSSMMGPAPAAARNRGSMNTQSKGKVGRHVARTHSHHDDDTTTTDSSSQSTPRKPLSPVSMTPPHPHGRTEKHSSMDNMDTEPISEYIGRESMEEDGADSRSKGQPNPNYLYNPSAPIAVQLGPNSTHLLNPSQMARSISDPLRKDSGRDNPRQDRAGTANSQLQKLKIVREAADSDSHMADMGKNGKKSQDWEEPSKLRKFVRGFRKIAGRERYDSSPRVEYENDRWGSDYLQEDSPSAGGTYSPSPTRDASPSDTFSSLSSRSMSTPIYSATGGQGNDITNMVMEFGQQLVHMDESGLVLDMTKDGTKVLYVLKSLGYDHKITCSDVVVGKGGTIRIQLTDAYSGEDAPSQILAKVTASVVISQSHSDMYIMVRKDDLGAFSFLPVRSGTFRIICSYDGIVFASIPVECPKQSLIPDISRYVVDSSAAKARVRVYASREVPLHVPIMVIVSVISTRSRSDINVMAGSLVLAMQIPKKETVKDNAKDVTKDKAEYFTLHPEADSEPPFFSIPTHMSGVHSFKLYFSGTLLLQFKCNVVFTGHIHEEDCREIATSNELEEFFDVRQVRSEGPEEGFWEQQTTRLSESDFSNPDVAIQLDLATAISPRSAQSSRSSKKSLVRAKSPLTQRKVSALRSGENVQTSDADVGGTDLLEDSAGEEEGKDKDSQKKKKKSKTGKLADGETVEDEDVKRKKSGGKKDKKKRSSTLRSSRTQSAGDSVERNCSEGRHEESPSRSKKKLTHDTSEKGGKGKGEREEKVQKVEKGKSVGKMPMAQVKVTPPQHATGKGIVEGPKHRKKERRSQEFLEFGIDPNRPEKNKAAKTNSKELTVSSPPQMEEGARYDQEKFEKSFEDLLGMGFADKGNNSDSDSDTEVQKENLGVSEGGGDWMKRVATSTMADLHAGRHKKQSADDAMCEEMVVRLESAKKDCDIELDLFVKEIVPKLKLQAEEWGVKRKRTSTGNLGKKERKLTRRKTFRDKTGKLFRRYEENELAKEEAAKASGNRYDEDGGSMSYQLMKQEDERRKLMLSKLRFHASLRDITGIVEDVQKLTLQDLCTTDKLTEAVTALHGIMLLSDWRYSTCSLCFGK